MARLKDTKEWQERDDIPDTIEGQKICFLFPSIGFEITTGRQAFVCSSCLRWAMDKDPEMSTTFLGELNIRFIKEYETINCDKCFKEM